MNNFYLYNSNDDPKLHQKRYSNLQTIEFKNQVISCHETYLNLDDTDLRDQFRKKLHKYVVNYLLKISHHNKFLLPEFNLIFENCIENNPNFEPLKAAESFDILFRVTNNLILRPWRKEFHSICIYNGHFKHLISQQIPHYEHILKFLGYDLKSKDGIHNYYLTRRNNQEEIWRLISFDTYVAYVEFRFIYQFGEILRSKNIKPNWQHIFRLRKKFTGDFESTLENYLLIYHDQINEQQQRINRKYKHLSNLISQYEEHQADGLIDKQRNGNLIDLDSNLPPISNKFEELEQLLINSSNDNCYSQPTTSYNHQTIRTNDHANYLQQNSDNYYLTKHLVTNSLNHNSHQFQAPKETDLDQVDFISDAEEKDIGSSVNLKDELNSKIKCLDNNAQKLELAMRSDNDKRNNTVSSSKVKSNSLEKKSKIKSIDKKYNTLDSKNDKRKRSSNKWICKFCTFANDRNDTICKMCSKSMIHKTNDNELAILGKECNLCTLVNKKSLSSCQACGNSLTSDCPTYI